MLVIIQKDSLPKSNSSYTNQPKNITRFLLVYVGTPFIIINVYEYNTCKFIEYQWAFLWNGLPSSDYNGIVHSEMLNLGHYLL